MHRSPVNARRLIQSIVDCYPIDGQYLIPGMKLPIKDEKFLLLLNYWYYLLTNIFLTNFIPDDLWMNSIK